MLFVLPVLGHHFSGSLARKIYTGKHKKWHSHTNQRALASTLPTCAVHVAVTNCWKEERVFAVRASTSSRDRRLSFLQAFCGGRALLAPLHSFVWGPFTRAKHAVATISSPSNSPSCSLQREMKFWTRALMCIWLHCRAACANNHRARTARNWLYTLRGAKVRGSEVGANAESGPFVRAW